MLRIMDAHIRLAGFPGLHLIASAKQLRGNRASRVRASLRSCCSPCFVTVRQTAVMEMNLLPTVARETKFKTKEQSLVAIIIKIQNYY